ncbi:hypothetical protein DCAR_0103005 [Daucus carota subsp. sativus]|uniref:DUF789 domain-containing protein n=1 Tax=Daucus carota subsp. sativus TaxID=79200 RepID=A0AAF0W5Z3_DAUCS|nr:hypothetical protein DCAR_0103005 [Daucus carota subsp. sativus]
MAGTGGYAVSRSHGGDRFYNPPAMRRQQQLLLQQKQEKLQHMQLHRPEKSPTPVVVEPEKQASSEDSTATLLKIESLSTCSDVSPSPRSNLDCLVEAVTPSVPARYSSEVNVRGRRSREAVKQPFYCLGDLWESLKEGSAYGAGVPLVLNESDSIMQYYVPYLSGIQLYVDPRKLPYNVRRPDEDTDTDSSKETSSCACGDFEPDKQRKCAKHGLQSPQNPANLNSRQLNSPSLRDKSVMSSLGSEGETSNSSGLLVCEFFEQEQPYIRKPLTDKIIILESQFPNLSMYRSCDLLPTSWISIAWYPIYRIPMGSTLKDLDASFLTFYSLSTQIGSGGPSPRVNSMIKASSKISLPLIGLASYKYKGSILSPCGPQECEKEKALMQAADDWLQGLKVYLPDFKFFQSHYSSWRR